MSIVQICNRGLSQYLGYQRINSMTEDSPGARECSLHYDDLRISLLEKHWWVFAKKRQALALMTNDRTDQWSYKYQMPANNIETHWINDPATAEALIAANENPDGSDNPEGRALNRRTEFEIIGELSEDEYLPEQD